MMMYLSPLDKILAKLRSFRHDGALFPWQRLSDYLQNEPLAGEQMGSKVHDWFESAFEVAMQEVTEKAPALQEFRLHVPAITIASTDNLVARADLLRFLMKLAEPAMALP